MQTTSAKGKTFGDITIAQDFGAVTAFPQQIHGLRGRCLNIKHGLIPLLTQPAAFLFCVLFNGGETLGNNPIQPANSAYYLKTATAGTGFAIALLVQTTTVGG